MSSGSTAEISSLRKCHSFGNGKRDFRGMGSAFARLSPVCPDLLSGYCLAWSDNVLAEQRDNPTAENVTRRLCQCAVNDTVSMSVGIRG